MRPLSADGEDPVFSDRLPRVKPVCVIVRLCIVAVNAGKSGELIVTAGFNEVPVMLAMTDWSGVMVTLLAVTSIAPPMLSVRSVMVKLSCPVGETPSKLEKV